MDGVVRMIDFRDLDRMPATSEDAEAAAGQLAGANDIAAKIGDDLFGRGGNAAALPARSEAVRDVRVETERLVLRPLSLDDFADYATMMSDPDKFRYSERGPMTGDEAWTRLLRNAGHWALLGHGPFAVVEKATGRFVGEVGLSDFRRGLGAPFDGYPEASWSIVTAAQGRGYATEAAAAVHAWLGVHVNAERTVCIIHADNHASHRVAQKLGYVPFAERTFRGYAAVLFERGWSRTATGRLSSGAGTAQRAATGKHPGLASLAALRDLWLGRRPWRVHTA